METVQVNKSDLGKILSTVEILIDEVENALSQDELAKKRFEEITSGKIKGKSEKDLDEYLKRRGVKLG